MPKVYKVSMYVTDYNDDYSIGERLKGDIEDRLDGLWVHTNHVELEESDYFEWDDKLAINKIKTDKSDFEKYFNKKEDKL